MSEVMACPRCKEAPNTKHWSDLEEDISIYCCGVTVDGGPDQWNEYAAAMDAALAEDWKRETSAVARLHLQDQFPLSEHAWAELWASSLASQDAAVEARLKAEKVFTGELV